MVDNEIQIGDRVYIGGIFGDDFKMINNKVGIVKRIMFSSSEHYATYLVDVSINGKIFPLNLSFVYKLDDFDIYDYDGLLNGSSPLEFYFKKFRIIGRPSLLYDQLGLNHLYCKTKDNNIQPLTITSLN